MIYIYDTKPYKKKLFDKKFQFVRFYFRQKTFIALFPANYNFHNRSG